MSDMFWGWTRPKSSSKGLSSRLTSDLSTLKRDLEKSKKKWRKPSIIYRDAFPTFVNDTTSKL